MKFNKFVKTLQQNIVHECGISAAFNISHGSTIVRNMLSAQQERGEAGCGIGSFHEGNMFVEKDNGTVAEVFPDGFLFDEKLPGKMAVGHNRYPTKGSKKDKCNLQPFFFKQTRFGEFMVLHNGQFTNHEQLKQNILVKGVATQSNSDSELAGLKILQSKADNIEDAIKEVMPTIESAYSLMFMTPKQLFVMRDKYGVRPLSVAKFKEGYLIASETGAFRTILGAEYAYDVAPGELLVFDVDKPEEPRKIQIAIPKEKWCIMEGIYFSFPRSSYNGCMHETFRFSCGEEIFEENKSFFEDLKSKYSEDELVVVPILNSGRQAAFGFSDASKIKYREYFMRRTNISGSTGRSFTSTTEKERLYKAMMKLDLNEESVKNKVVITVDDSIVRGVTSRVNNQRLLDAGAKKVINIIASPPITNPCYLGMDYQTKKELAAHNKTSSQEIADEIMASKLIYLSREGLNAVVKNTYKAGICSGCFGGNYASEKLRPHNKDL